MKRDILIENGSTEELYEATEDRYVSYAVYVNEDRAIPCNIDGLKPSGRRGIWTMYKARMWSNEDFKKAAKVVGNMLSDYHPHGDSGTYSAIVTFTNFCPCRLAEGDGNWGSFSDSKVAAYRYTLLRMSKYTEAVFFDKFYTPVIQTVLNYNSEEDKREPVYIPCLLPNALLNGATGIGVGASSNSPSFTMESVGAILEKILTGAEITPKLCAKYLKFTTLYQATPEVDKDSKLELFKTGRGKVQFRSTGVIDKNKRTLLLDKFADFNLERALSKCQEDDRVKIVNDVSDVTDKYGKILIELKNTTPVEKVDSAFKDIINKYFSYAESYDIYVTERSTSDGETHKSRLMPSSTVDMLKVWVEDRLKLEKKACYYWIDNLNKQISNRYLLIKAVDSLEIIIAALRKKLSKDELRTFIAKQMKISEGEAEIIINLKVFQLRKLEKDGLLKEIKDMQNTISGYKKRIKNPNPYIVDQIKNLCKTLDPLKEQVKKRGK